jgi:mono/diheme cytochrome c family protein
MSVSLCSFKMAQRTSARVLGVLLAMSGMLRQDARAAAPVRPRIDPAELPAPLTRPVKYFGDIHPILAEHCVSCHGPDKQKGGLRLDSREMALMGGSGHGPAIVPGNSAESPMLVFMAHLEPEMEMPPKKEKLSETAIAMVRTWIDQGAEWTSKAGGQAAISTLGNQELFFKKAAAHWSFQPVAKASPESLQDGAAAIDSLVEAKRKERGVAGSPRAEARTLLRRLHFDLTGIPAAPEEADVFEAAFARDSVAAIIAKVDELLASPHFGERWGRYWLDIARYADTQDLFPGQDLRYPFAWTYRDYVIGAFNADKPYNQFIREQIAADLIGLKPNDSTLAALGFLTVGPRFLRSKEEQINDRIDVVTRGLMGLTVACARCHDHKFDPIPTADFYALRAIFENSVIPDELPSIKMPGVGEDPALRAEYDAAKARTQKSILELTERERAKAVSEALSKPETYFDAVCDVEYGKKPINSILNTTKLSNCVLTPLGNQLAAFKKTALKCESAILGPLAAVMAAAAAEKETLIESMIKTGRLPRSESEIHPLVIRVLREKSPGSEEALVRAHGAILALAQKSEEAGGSSVRDAFLQSGGLLDFQMKDIEKTAPNTVAARGEYRKLYGELAETESTHLGAPIRAMVVKDADPLIKNHAVFVRGDPSKRGDAVERRFIEVLAPAKKPFAAAQSGRAELAEHIASSKNPLTPRVWANQVWRHLIGRPLTKATGDFGLQSEPPTHPQLLDWLASALVQRNWSTKKLVRDIVLSATYQQASLENRSAEQSDADNVWLWRGNRRRLDLESMRDAVLTASGRLEPKIGGRAVPLSAEPFTGRRTVYGFIDRVRVDPMFVAFDFPSPDISNTERTETLVPQQALFALNDAFMISQARALAAAALGQSQAATAAGAAGNPAMKPAGELMRESIRMLYRRVHQRMPLEEEERFAMQLMREGPAPLRESGVGLWQYGVGSADPTVPRLNAFKPLVHFDGDSKRYQAAPIFPDREHGYVSLSARGGHPGADLKSAAIRRWIAPSDGNFTVAGEVAVNPKGSGDGVRARVISSNGGLMKEWILDRQKLASCETSLETVALRAGEILDFTVDCLENPTGDGFSWSLVVRSAGPDAMHGKPLGVWDSQADFKPPPPPKLSPLEELAQALLMTNEFMFVD